MALPVSSPISALHYQHQQQVEIPLTSSPTTSSHPSPPSAFSTAAHHRARTAAVAPSRSGSLPPLASASSHRSASTTMFQLHSPSTSTPITVRKPNRAEHDRSTSRPRASPPKPTLARLQTQTSSSGTGSSALHRVSTATTATTSSSNTSSSSSSHQSHTQSHSMSRSRDNASCRPLPPPPPPAPKLSVETQNLKQPNTRKRASTVDVPPATLSAPITPVEPPRIHVTSTPSSPPMPVAANSALRPLPSVPAAMLSPPTSPTSGSSRRNVSSPPRMNRRRIGGPRAVVEGQRQGRRAPQLAFDPMSSTWVIQPSSPSRMPHSPFHNPLARRPTGLNPVSSQGHTRSMSDQSIRASAAAKGKGKEVVRDNDSPISSRTHLPLVPAKPSTATTAPNSPVMGSSSSSAPLTRYNTDPNLLLQTQSNPSTPLMAGQAPRATKNFYQSIPDHNMSKQPPAMNLPDWLADVAPLKPRREMEQLTNVPSLSHGGFLRSESPAIATDPIEEVEEEEGSVETEVYMDDGYVPESSEGTEDYTSMFSSHPSERSRSPSPIGFARPDELGLYDSDDEEYWGMIAERDDDASLPDIGDSMEFSKNPSPIERTYVLAYPSGQEVVRGHAFPSDGKDIDDDDDEDDLKSTTTDSRRRTKSGGSFPSSAELMRIGDRYSNGNSPVHPGTGYNPWAKQQQPPPTSYAAPSAPSSISHQQYSNSSSSGHGHTANSIKAGAGSLKSAFSSLEPKRREQQQQAPQQTQAKKKRSSQGGFFFGVARDSSPKGSYSPDRGRNGDAEVARGRQGSRK